jgi:hypothetical protein
MEFSNWNYINLALMFFSGYIAIGCFKRENTVAGWINLFASSLNGALFFARLL